MENIHKSTTENIISPDGVPTPSEGLALPGGDSLHGETSLVAPGPTMHHSEFTPVNYHSAPASSDLLNYLARPNLLTSGVFTTDTSTAVYSSTFKPSFFQNYFPNISGVLGYRATVCFRAELASAPQAQGIVRMVYEYMPPDGPLSKASYRPVASQLPGTEINLRSESALEVKIPYVSDRDFWFLINGTYTNNSTAFRLSLFPYAPVSWDTTTVSTPSWMLWFWFEDVELVSKSCPTVAVTPQAGTNPEASVAKVSTWFKYASKISAYAGTIPSLTSIAMPVSWAFETGAKIAAHFGWSKPNNGSYMGVMGSSFARGLNTCVDVDHANPMGFYANNEVGVLPGFAGNDMDEMSICYLTCKPGLISAFRLLATDARQQVKWTCPVNPGCFAFQSSDTGFAQLSAMGLGSTATTGNKPGYFPSPICFCASFFERWRGDIIFRFKFDTTKFHAGKVLIGYVPGEDVSDGVTAGGFSQAPDPSRRYDYHSVILDLRNTEEYDFVVPFTYPSAWCDTGMALNSSGVFSVPNTGSVFMRVLEPLYGPDNVPQFAPVLVEVLGTCGLEFSQPITSIMKPLDTASAVVVVAQSGDLAAADASTYATGERILSLKQVAMRPFWSTNFGAKIFGTASLAAWSVGGFVAQAGTYAAPTTSLDTILSRVSSCYALVRGGIIVRLAPAFDGSTTTPANWFSFVQWAPYNIQDIRCSAIGIESRMANMVRIPYYGKNTRMRTGWSARAGTTDPNSVTRTLTSGNANFNESPVIFGVSAADDYQLGAFTGVPPCVTFEPNNAASAADNYMRRDPGT